MRVRNSNFVDYVKKYFVDLEEEELDLLILEETKSLQKEALMEVDGGTGGSIVIRGKKQNVDITSLEI